MGDYTLIETFTDSTGHFNGSSALGTLTVNAPPPTPPQVAALELAVDAAMLSVLGNPGAMAELQLFSQVFLNQTVPTSPMELVGEIQALYPQTDGLGLAALGAAMFIAGDLEAENPT